MNRRGYNQTKERFVTARPCPYCEREMSSEFLTDRWNKRHAVKSESIKTTLLNKKALGISVGRPPKERAPDVK